MHNLFVREATKHTINSYLPRPDAVFGLSSHSYDDEHVAILLFHILNFTNA